MTYSIQREAQLDPARAIGRWIKCLTQWAFALSELKDPRKIRIRPYIDGGIQVITINTPPAHQSRKQAGLLELLEEVFKNGRGEIVLKALNDLAARRVSKDNAGHGWDMLLEENLDRWSGSFTEKYHCEAVLCSLMWQRTIPPELDEEAASDFSDLLDTVHVSI